MHLPNENILGNGYTFYNWSQIDIFVYFSHHLITIPPLSWINIAHRNGVKIFGTFITEFDDGTKLCETIFRTYDSTIQFAQNLTTITKLFNLDGWLLNIENKIENVTILTNMKLFIKYFTQLVHEINEENMIIWYDSVTENGKLSWQNELNLQNKYKFSLQNNHFIIIRLFFIEFILICVMVFF